MSRHQLEVGEVWFGTNDAPVPSGPREVSTPSVTVGVSPVLEDPVVHVRYRRRGGTWKRLQLRPVRSGPEGQFLAATFPPLPSGARIEYAVFFRSGGRRPTAERRVGESLSFQVSGSPPRPSSPNATPAAPGPGRSGTPAAAVPELARSPVGERSQRDAALEPDREARRLSSNDVAASRLLEALERHGIGRLEELRKLSATDLRDLLDSAGPLASGASTNAELVGKTPVPKRGSRSGAAPESEAGSPEATAPADSARPPADHDGAISGLVLRPRGFSQLETIEIRAYADPDLSQEIGTSHCDVTGRFVVAVSRAAEARPAWFRWSTEEAFGRTPVFEPRLPGQPFWVCPYRLAVHPGAAGRLTRRSGRVLASTGAPVVGAQVWLVEHALRGCQYLTSTETSDDGSFRLAFPTDALLDAAQPDLRFLAFGGPARPLIASRSADLVLPVESVDVRSLYEDIGDAVRRHSHEGDPRLAPEQAAYIERRTGVSARAILAFERAQELALAAGADPAVAFALLRAPVAHDFEAMLLDSVHLGVVPSTVLSRPAQQSPGVAELSGDSGRLLDVMRGPELGGVWAEIKTPEERLALLRRWNDAATPDDFEDQLRTDAELRSAAPRLRRMLELSNTVGEAPELVKSLVASLPESEGLGTLATWSVGRWEHHLTEARITPVAAFGGGEDGLRAYAGHLSKRFAARYPLSAAGELALRSDRDFARLDHAKVVDTRAAATFGGIRSASRKKRTKKLHAAASIQAVAGQVEAASRLLEDGVGTARAAARMGRREFTSQFGEAFVGGEVDAAVAHTRARRTAALGNYAFVALAGNATAARGLASPELKGKQRERASEALKIRDPVELDRTWEELSGRFGRSFCECAHCRSIFGPAAYLFDMLLFLHRFTTAPEPHSMIGKRLLQTLMERRVDVLQLHLSCENTNVEVPQIDLVNELLWDLVDASAPEPSRPLPVVCQDNEEPIGPIECAADVPPSSSSPKGAEEAERPDGVVTDNRFRCAGPERETQGTSAERRASPQNEPPPSVLNRLKGAGFPWTLPYDHTRDKAWQATNALAVDRAELALELWRLAEAGAQDQGLAALETLASQFLNLSDGQRALLVTPPYSLADVWGPAVAAAVVDGSGPTLDSLRVAGELNFSALDAALTSVFVSGEGERTYELLPAFSCDASDVRLVGAKKELCRILDRLHRFERLRRHLGWPVHVLDGALDWLGGELGDEVLVALGALKFLEAKLDVSPQQVLALFHDPSATRRTSLVAGKTHESSFSKLFGDAGTQLPLSDDPEAAISLISGLSGEEPSAVRFVLEQGYADSVDEELSGSANIFAFADPHATIRRAATATCRATRLARAVRLPAADLVHLIKTFDADPFPWPGNAVPPQTRILNAVRLLSLADESRSWHLDPVDVRYVATTDRSIERSRGLDAEVVGQTWLALLAAVAERQSKHETESLSGRALLRQALNELLRPASPDGATATALESTVSRLMDLLSWHALFPELLDHAVALLPASIPATEYPVPEEAADGLWDPIAGQLAGWIEAGFPDARADVPAADDDETTESCVCPSETGEATVAPLTDGEEGAGVLQVDVGTAAYATAEGDLFAAAQQYLALGSEADQTELVASLANLLSSLGIDLEPSGVASLAARYVRRAVEYAANSHAESLEASAQLWSDVLLVAATRRDVEDLVAAALASLCSVDQEVVELLLRILCEPDTESPLLRAFVAEDGTIPRIAQSLPTAHYSRQSAAADVLPNEAWVRAEPSLHLDWTSTPPPDGLGVNEFSVQLEARFSVDSLLESGRAASLVLGTTGTATLGLVATTTDETVLIADGEGALEFIDAPAGRVDTFIAGLSGRQELVTLRVSYEAPAAPGAAVLRVTARADDEILETAWPGNLRDSILLLHKATRVVGAAKLPAQIWQALPTSSTEIDLDALPLKPTEPRWTNAWLQLSRLPEIWSRRASDDLWPELFALVGAEPLSFPATSQALLGLSDGEIEQLRSQSEPQSSGPRFPVGRRLPPRRALLPARPPAPLSPTMPALEPAAAMPTGLTDAQVEGLRGLAVDASDRRRSRRDPIRVRQLPQALRLIDLSRRLGVSFTVLLRWDEHTSRERYAHSVGALRSQLPQPGWFEALATINDPVRERLRDAMVAWLTSHSRIVSPPGQPPLQTVPPFESAEVLSDSLFTDVQVSSCLQTSRVQFAYSAVLRYVDAMRLGFEPGPQPGERERFEREWSWRRQYRLWEANRRVFVHPENWLEPDLRPEKTELFGHFEDELMSRPLTSRAGERALVGYAKELAGIARPEVIAIVDQQEQPDLHVPYGFRDPDLAGTHVFARTRTQPRKIYYRRRHPTQDGRWTPWEELPAELPGTHYLAVVVFGRVRLIAATVEAVSPSKRGKCEPPEANAGLPDSGGPNPETEVSFTWMDRQHGQWTPPASMQRYSVTAELEAQVSHEEIWNASFPWGEFEALSWDLGLLDKLDVRVKFGANGPAKGSKLNVSLKSAGSSKLLKAWKAPSNYANKTLTVSNTLAENDDVSSAEDVLGIQLDWRPRTDHVDYWIAYGIAFPFIGEPIATGIAAAIIADQGLERDDVEITGVSVVFKNDALGRTLPAIDVPMETDRTPAMSRRPSKSSAIFEAKDGFPVWLTAGPRYAGISLGSAWRYFEAQVQVSPDAIPPQPSMFESCATPKHHSVDLGRALSLRVERLADDSFDIVVRVNDRTFEHGEAATKFALTNDAVVANPETCAWRDKGWVDGAPLCTKLKTRPRDALTLRVFADGSSARIAFGSSGQVEHEGTRRDRQDLVTEKACLETPSWMSTAFPMYCSGTRAVSAPTCYRLVVPSDEPVSSFHGPKVVDEDSTEDQLGRTFFVERIWEPGPEKKKSAGIAERCYKVPIFEGPEPELGWEEQVHGAPVKWPEVNGPLTQSPPDWRLGPGGKFAKMPGHVVRSWDSVPAGFPPIVDFESGGFMQPVGIDKGLALMSGGTIEDWQVGKKFKVEVVCVPAGTALALKATQKIALEEGIRSSKGQMMVASSGQSENLVEKWAFRTFWHPQAVGLLRTAEGLGVPRMLAYRNQALDSSSDLQVEAARQDFFSWYDPSGVVSNDWPTAKVDFSVDGAYADYNWELFYHCPLLIAQRLSEAGRFEEAERWFRLLYDPTQGRLVNDPALANQTFPLRHAEDRRVEDMLHLLESGSVREEFEKQVERLNRYPYQPHLIARHRVSAYQKALFMRYLDHLIAWGDMLFRRAYGSDNRSDLETASARYDLVAKLLGKRPDSMPDRTGGTVGCFISLIMGSGATSIEDVRLWDPVARFSELIDGTRVTSGPLANDGEGVPELYFCVPHNDKLLEYWDTLAERLSNLRNCRDIEGVERTLSLYGARIDPGLLVRATAEGLDIDVLLGYLSAPLPRFRFTAMLQRAREAADRARSFGESLLSAIEKRESEGLARLRAGQELSLLKAVKLVRSEQLDEARESLKALRKSLAAAEVRLDFYTSRDRISFKERSEGEALSEAGSAEQQAASAAATASDWAWVPNLEITARAGVTATPPYYYAEAGVGSRYSVGGDTGVKVYQNKADGLRNEAAAQRVKAALVGRQGSFDRRWEDWELQADLARKDIQQIGRQITAAEIRIAIAEIERDNQQLQIDNAQAVDAFLRDKFTNAQLYRWIESRLSRVYYQQYRLAFDLAHKAQRALYYELGLADAPPLPDAWDAQNRGMEAAAMLQHELQKLQQTHIDAWRREHEKTKIFSLYRRQPLAFIDLRETGSCVFEIVEMDLDEDEPGDYFRRIKAVFVDIPCVRGPDVSVNARLTLLRSTVRTQSHRATDPYYPREEGSDGIEDKRFRDDPGGVDHIVTSSGVNDAGLHEANLADETRLPFEGAGVISTWCLELPLETNLFDRASLSDVKLRILYTGRAGAEPARAAALDARRATMADRPKPVMFDLGTKAPDEWHRFVHGGVDGHELNLSVTRDDLPRGVGDPRIVATDVCFEMQDGETLQVVGGDAVGTIRSERGMTCLKLRSPLRLGEELVLRLAANSGVPVRADLLVWLRSE